MSEPARNRFALDLEDLERQLRGAGQMPRPGQQVDPLAELTRIVGQDDPLKEIFAERAQAPAPAPVAAWPGTRQEPSFAQMAPKPAPAPEVRGALDEFEALLRRTEGGRAPQAAQPVAVPQPQQPSEPHYEASQAPHFQPFDPHGGGQPPRDLDEVRGGYVAAAPAPDYDYEPSESVDQTYVPEEEMPDLEPRRSRKGLVIAAAIVVIGVAGVGAAMALRGSKVTADGAPPTIVADQSPVKIQPVNPGGAEIPNQNKQIYERAGEAPGGKTKVVSSEEQPVDVQQAARSMPSRVVLAGPGAPAANPLAQAPGAAEAAAPGATPSVATLTPAEPALVPVPAVPGLGEPRRVRTVSIRPDGSPAASGEAAAAQPTVTAALPPRAPAVAATPVAAPQPPARSPVAEAPKAQERVTPPAATTPSGPLKLASAAPSAPPAAQPATSATAAIRAGSGDFIVQLAAPGSEAEARATFAGLQRKYGNLLGGYSPIVRKTELAGGKTVYRLRVGPFSREDATSMCTQLQGAGGQCFIARN